jgi:hypothetical protein
MPGPASTVRAFSIAVTPPPMSIIAARASLGLVAALRGEVDSSSNIGVSACQEFSVPWTGHRGFSLKSWATLSKQRATSRTPWPSYGMLELLRLR